MLALNCGIYFKQFIFLWFWRGGGGRHTFVTLFVVEGQTFVTNCDKAGGGQFYAEIV